MANHSSILAWEILWTEEPGGLQFIGLQRVKTRLSMHTYSGYSVLHASEGARSSSSSDNHIHMCHLLSCGYISVTPRSGLRPFQLISVKQCSWIYSLSGQDVVQSQSHDRLFATPMDCSTPGLPVPHHLSGFAQVHAH